MPDPDENTRADEEGLPKTPLYAYKEGRDDDIEVDAEVPVSSRRHDKAASKETEPQASLAASSHTSRPRSAPCSDPRARDPGAWLSPTNRCFALRIGRRITLGLPAATRA
jgi:hypothetical protein